VTPGGVGPGIPGAVPNPYDLGTWRERAAQEERRRALGERSTGPRGQGRRADQDARTGRPPGPPPASAPESPAEQDRTDREPVDADPVDPPELPRRDDSFELARRTVNRSRAAARDRGLFPISAKTQGLHERRSRSTPGYSGSRPDPRDPQGLESVMRRVLGDLGWVEGMNSGRVLEEWDQIVGESVAENCTPVSLDEGVLVVSAKSSAWATQMRMLTPRLISTIEEHVGAHVVSELRVTGPAAAERSWKKGRRTVTWRGPRDTYG
jgi:predicted nucleic acid-binding Zn ribbon protein